MLGTGSSGEPSGAISSTGSKLSAPDGHFVTTAITASRVAPVPWSRSAVHTGEVEIRPDDVVGLTVNIAKRICDLAGPGRTFVSETVKGQLIGSDIATSDQGTHILKGVPERWKLFAAET